MTDEEQRAWNEYLSFYALENSEIDDYYQRLFRAVDNELSALRSSLREKDAEVARLREEVEEEKRKVRECVVELARLRGVKRTCKHGEDEDVCVYCFYEEQARYGENGRGR